MLLRIVGVQIQIEIENGWCTADTDGIQSIQYAYHILLRFVLV